MLYAKYRRIFKQNLVLKNQSNIAATGELEENEVEIVLVRGRWSFNMEYPLIGRKYSETT